MEIGLYRPSNHRRRGGQTYEKSEQTNEQTNRQPNDIHSMYQVRIGGQYATRSEEVSAHIYIQNTSALRTKLQSYTPTVTCTTEYDSSTAVLLLLQ